MGRRWLVSHACRALGVALIGLGWAAMCPAQSGSSPAWQAEFNAGAEAFRGDQMEEALGHFQRVIAKVPSFAPAHLNAGLAAERLRRYDLAISELRNALRLQPGIRGAELFLGISLYNTERYHDAQTALEDAVKQTPNNPQVLQWLGLNEMALGRVRQAAAELDHASDLDPTNVDILYFAGRAHSLASTEAFERLYKADSKSWRIHEILGEAYARADRHEESIAEYTEAIDLAPREPQLHYWLAVEYANSSRASEAIEAYHRELEISPSSYESMYGLGLLQVQRDQSVEGVAVLRKAVAGDPTRIEAYYYLGLGEKNLGDYQSAERDLLKAGDENQDPDLRQRSFYALSQVYRAEKKPAEGKAALDKFVALKAASDASQKERFAALMKKHAPQPTPQPEAADP
jgi:tetratricopeptide (TPR) repeat protein